MIQIIPLAGPALRQEVGSHWEVRDILLAVGLCPTACGLVCNGKQLDLDARLASLDLGREASLRVTGKLRGGLRASAKLPRQVSPARHQHRAPRSLHASPQSRPSGGG